MKNKIEKFIERTKHHPIILLCVIIAIVTAFFVETPQKIAKIWSWSQMILKSGKDHEYSLLSNVDLGLTRNVIEKDFGIPKTEYKTDDIVECAYIFPNFRLCCIYQNNSVVAFSIMTRTSNFTPAIKIGDHISILGKTLFKDFLPNYLQVIQWEISTVPRDTMYYETIYLGNARNYATCLLGYSSELGAKTKFDQEAADWLDEIPIEARTGSVVNLTPEEKQSYLNRLRNNSSPNIVGISSLHSINFTQEQSDKDINGTLIYSGSEIRDGGLHLK